MMPTLNFASTNTTRRYAAPESRRDTTSTTTLPHRSRPCLTHVGWQFALRDPGTVRHNVTHQLGASTGLARRTPAGLSG